MHYVHTLAMARHTTRVQMHTHTHSRGPKCVFKIQGEWEKASGGRESGESARGTHISPACGHIQEAGEIAGGGGATGAGVRAEGACCFSRRVLTAQQIESQAGRRSEPGSSGRAGALIDLCALLSTSVTWRPHTVHSLTFSVCVIALTPIYSNLITHTHAATTPPPMVSTKLCSFAVPPAALKIYQCHDHETPTHTTSESAAAAGACVSSVITPSASLALIAAALQIAQECLPC